MSALVIFMWVFTVCDWHVIAISQQIFAEFDKDESGTMDMFELRSGLEKQGIIVSATVFRF